MVDARYGEFLKRLVRGERLSRGAIKKRTTSEDPKRLAVMGVAKKSDIPSQICLNVTRSAEEQPSSRIEKPVDTAFVCGSNGKK